MFEGSEGPQGAAGGRHEQRQTRQVLSAFFFCRILRIQHRGADMAAMQSAETGALRVGGNPPIPGHYVQLTNPRTLKAAI